MEKTKKVNSLKNLTCLKERVAVYVPSTVNVDEEVDNTSYVHEVLKEFSEIFGGATAINADGAWVSNEKGIVLEKNTIIYSFTNNLNNETIDKILNICQWLKDEMKQEAISLVINNQLYFI